MRRRRYESGGERGEKGTAEERRWKATKNGDETSSDASDTCVCVCVYRPRS